MRTARVGVLGRSAARNGEDRGGVYNSRRQASWLSRSLTVSAVAASSNTPAESSFFNSRDSRVFTSLPSEVTSDSIKCVEVCSDGDTFRAVSTSGSKISGDSVRRGEGERQTAFGIESERLRIRIVVGRHQILPA